MNVVTIIVYRLCRVLCTACLTHAGNDIDASAIIVLQELDGSSGNARFRFAGFLGTEYTEILQT